MIEKKKSIISNTWWSISVFMRGILKNTWSDLFLKIWPNVKHLILFYNPFGVELRTFQHAWMLNKTNSTTFPGTKDNFLWTHHSKKKIRIIFLLWYFLCLMLTLRGPERENDNEFVFASKLIAASIRMIGK